MFKEFSTGISHFWSASAFLSKHKLLHYYLYPLIIGILYFVFLASVVFMFARDLTELMLGSYLPEKLPEYEGFFSFLNALGKFSLHGLVSIVVGIVVFMVSAKFSKYIILILLSPVFSILSEKAETALTGKEYPFSLIQFLKDILRGTIIAIRNLILELLLIALFSIAGIFAGPLAILVAPLLWIIGAYYYGFSMMDYVCERRKMSISAGNAYIRKRRYFVCGNGVMYSLFEMIPYIGTMLAAVNGVVGACTGLISLENQENITRSGSNNLNIQN